MWMRDEAEEKIIDEAGCSGQLNHDPKNPELGVYFSLADPSKMGWYLDMTTDIGEPKSNSDGTSTYDVTVTLSNVISQKDVINSAWYITGSYGGSIMGFIHIFAPSEGHFEEWDTNNGMYLYDSIYHDLEVIFTQGVIIEPGEDIEITFQVTTDRRAEAPLKVRQTPTLTEYRNSGGATGAEDDWDVNYNENEWNDGNDWDLQ